MSYPKTSVLYYPASTGVSEDITAKITNWKTSNSIDKKAGVFNIGVINPQGLNTGSLQYGDNIEIKVGWVGSPLVTVFFGVIEEESVRSNGILEYRGIDYAGKLMDSLVQQVYTSGTTIGSLYRVNSNGVGSTVFVHTPGDVNSDIVVQHLIKQFYYKSLPNDELDYVTYIGSSCKGWATVTAFEGVGSDFFKSFTNKRLIECINEVKSNNFTGNGDYLFYVDNQKKIHFIPKPSYVYDEKIDFDNDVLSFDLSRGTSNQYTAIMVNAGQVSGNNYDSYCAGYNRTAIRQSGWKWGYVDEKGIAANIDIVHPDWSIDDREDLTKSLGRDRANAIARDQGLPKWGGKVIIRGNNNYSLGSAYNVILETKRFGDGEGNSFGNKQLRLIGIDNEYTDKGWFTTLELKQDYGDIR